MLIGIASCYVYGLTVWAGNSPNIIALAVIVGILWIGWFLRNQFKSWEAPAPPPPKPAAPGKPAAKGGFKLPFGKKPAPPPPPPKPAAPPPRAGPLDFLKPKIKGAPKK